MEWLSFRVAAQRVVPFSHLVGRSVFRHTEGGARCTGGDKEGERGRNKRRVPDRELECVRHHTRHEAPVRCSGVSSRNTMRTNAIAETKASHSEGVDDPGTATEAPATPAAAAAAAAIGSLAMRSVSLRFVDHTTEMTFRSSRVAAVLKWATVIFVCTALPGAFFNFLTIGDTDEVRCLQHCSFHSCLQSVGFRNVALRCVAGEAPRFRRASKAIHSFLRCGIIFAFLSFCRPHACRCCPHACRCCPHACRCCAHACRCCPHACRCCPHACLFCAAPCVGCQVDASDASFPVSRTVWCAVGSTRGSSFLDCARGHCRALCSLFRCSGLVSNHRRLVLQRLCRWCERPPDALQRICRCQPELLHRSTMVRSSVITNYQIRPCVFGDMCSRTHLPCSCSGAHPANFASVTCLCQPNRYQHVVFGLSSAFIFFWAQLQFHPQAFDKAVAADVLVGMPLCAVISFLSDRALRQNFVAHHQYVRGGVRQCGRVLTTDG